ncbi:MAG TPA: undecaprenyl-diphosphate phosphatase [Patescibacteria group bacterium]|nr:undecaprenyl-diphosphate phosphatase [Patescibacteria group bacterium]
MTIFQSLILGAIEGFTEFLPISSTAHLLVGQRLLGLAQTSAFFTTVVQLGALGGLLVEERMALLRIIKQVGKTTLLEMEGVKLLLASVPVLIVGFAIRKHIDSIQSDFAIIAVMSIAVAFLLLLAQWKASHSTVQKAVSLKDYLVMGIFQVIAILPGTSRSGIVASAGMLSGLSFVQAMEQSFLLSIPALILAGGYEMLKVFHSGVEGSILAPTLIATVVAFATAIVSISWLRRTVNKVGFMPFIIYRILFGIFVLVVFTLH